MDTQVLVAIIGLLGVVLGAILQVVLPGSRFANWFSGKSRNHSLLGVWKSSWGPLPAGPLNRSSTMKITKHRGTSIEGHVIDSQYPLRKWSIEGRYENNVLLMFYYPAAESEDKDFMDFGSYFLRRQQDGSFKGYSAGFPTSTSSTDTGVDVHELHRV